MRPSSAEGITTVIPNVTAASCASKGIATAIISATLVIALNQYLKTAKGFSFAVVGYNANFRGKDANFH